MKSGYDLINAKIFTGGNKVMENFYIRTRGEKIAETGSMHNYIRSNNEIINLEGKVVIPGFIDAHVHFIQGGFYQLQLDFSGCESREDFISSVRKKCLQTPPGEWVVGMGYDHTKWGKGVEPGKDWLDSVSQANPVVCIRHDGHVGVANSLALKLAGIMPGTKIEGGIIYQNENGELTGLLKDAALYAVLRFSPNMTREGFLSALEKSTSDAMKAGLTTIGEMGDSSDPMNYMFYIDARKDGHLSVRIAYYPEISLVNDELLNSLNEFRQDDFFRFSGIKVFLDGSLGAKSAKFYTPYNGTDQRGIFSEFAANGMDDVMEKLREPDEMGYDFAIHAIGDEAVDLFAEIAMELAKNRTRKRRIRCEHFQHIRPDIWQRLPKEEVVLSVQPYHAVDDARWIEQVRPKEELSFAYPLNSILKNGFHLALGTDYPVAPLEPLKSIATAISRNDGNRRFSFLEDEAISLFEAIDAYTSGSAYSLKMENIVGNIAPGYYADLVILPKSFFNMEASEIADSAPLATFFNGKIKHCIL